MRNRIVRFSMVFRVTILAIVIVATITYADSVLPQSNMNNPSDWAKAEINKAKEISILPEQIEMEYRSNITREEFSEVAVKLYEILSGKESVWQGENPFTDTQNIKVRIAYSLGLIRGIGDGKFAPNDMITRQEISVILYRTLQAAKPDYNYSYSNEYIFADYDLISSWAREAVGYLYGIGVINGVGDNLFDPEGNTSTEEAIVVAKRIYDKVLTSKDNLIISRSGTSRRISVLKSKLEKLIPQEMGKPYKWGGTGPNSYDCSGLVYTLYGKLGISLPRVARSQAKVGVYVAKEDLTYGDLVFFASNGKNVNHVGIYVGNGEFVHAPQTGEVVKKTTLMSGYYERTYYTARRVID